MNDLVMRIRGAIWWALPLLVLVALLGLETDFGRAVYRHPEPEAPVVAKPVVVSLLPEYGIDGGAASRTETVSRTLFNPTRRPAPVAAPEVVKPRIQRGQFALTGTTVAGERSLAFLREVTGGKPRTVKLGDTVNGMLVAEVKADRVKLTLADESEELVLKVAANPRPTPQPAGAPPHVPGQPPVPGQAAAGPPSSAPADATPTLAERRRAAREAVAAQQAGAEAAAQGQPAPVPNQGIAVPAPAQAAPPAQPAATGTVGQPDQGWAAVFQRYQQRRN